MKGAFRRSHTTKNDVRNGIERLPIDECEVSDEDDYSPVKLRDENSAARITIMSNDDSIEEDCRIMNNSVERRSKSVYRKQGVVLATLNDFEIKKVLGRGSFGKVYLVQNTTTQEVFAMKALRKDLLIEKDLVESTRLEKTIL